MVQSQSTTSTSTRTITPRNLPDTPFEIARSEESRWLKKTHIGGTTPGFYFDTSPAAPYDVAIHGDTATIYPLNDEERRTRQLIRKARNENRPQRIDEDYFVCRCGNGVVPEVAEFEPCLSDGTYSTAALDRDCRLPNLYACSNCSRIINAETLRFCRRRKVKKAEWEEACSYDAWLPDEQ